MRVDRLLKLADFLEKNVSNLKFRMSTWSNDCGTVRCAMGWATAIPEFRDDGLRMITNHNFNYNYPEYSGMCGLDAAAAFFDITIEQAWWLFNPEDEDNITIEEVVERIRAECKKTQE